MAPSQSGCLILEATLFLRGAPVLLRNGHFDIPRSFKALALLYLICEDADGAPQNSVAKQLFVQRDIPPMHSQNLRSAAGIQDKHGNMDK